MSHTQDYVNANEKQFRKNPHSYLLNESYENEIIIDDATKEEQLEEIKKSKRQKWMEKEYQSTLNRRTPEQIIAIRKEHEIK